MLAVPGINNDRLPLHGRRRLAAEASGGDSSPVIHGMIERIARTFQLHGSVLDFGAGKGVLTARLLANRTFSDVTAADLMARPNNLPATVRWISADLNEPLELPGSLFHAIIAAEVIEHLESPRALAREWHRLLRPGGTLILSTPNNESWRSLLSLAFQGHFALFGPASYPAHITALVLKDIERSLAEAGFGTTRFFFTNHGAIPKLGRLRWQAISAGLLKGRRYSDNVIAVASKPDETRDTAP
jgi:2-polyprenyl-3-methyl-5-hydroxy-6-metoxy-1,4-benzoquinol methylase